MEIGLALRYSAVSLIGYAVDVTLLHLGLKAGLEADWARVISLVCAMHVTFLINGLVIFRRLRREHLARQWLSYMATNGFGNFCNYWIFLTLVSTHWPLVAVPTVALTAGSIAAWIINYSSTRFFVFAGRRGWIRSGPRRMTDSAAARAAIER
jgi:putative flippase GtrA